MPNRRRRIWTEEEKNSVVEKYKNGSTMTNLAKEFTTHTLTIKDILSEGGIHDTSNRRKWTKDEIDDIIHRYTIGYESLTTIGSAHGTKAGTISKILKENGVHIGTGNRLTVNRFIDHDFFEDIDTEKKAYFVGLLMADGCVRIEHQKYYTITLELIDRDIVERFAECVNADSKISKTKPNRKGRNPLYAITLRSNKMAQDLAKFGIIPNKTYKTSRLQIDGIPRNLRRHYFRGLYDGDGSMWIDKRTGRCYTTLTNYHSSFLDDVRKELYNLFPSVGIDRQVGSTNSAKRLGITGRYGYELVKILYQDNTISIKRKQEKADKIIVNDIV